MREQTREREGERGERGREKKSKQKEILYRKIMKIFRDSNLQIYTILLIR